MLGAFRFIYRLFGLPLLALGFVLWSGIAPIAAENVFASTLTSLASSDGAVLASVSPGAELKVLKMSGERLKVQISGWSPQGGEKYLFSEIGQRILVAELTDNGQKIRVVAGQKQDYYENVWQDITLVGWVDKKDTSDNVVDIWQSARTLFRSRCTRCHALHRPTEFKANQWPSILKIMTVRAGLSADQKALVTQYLQTYAKGQTDAPALDDNANSAADDDPTIAKITGDAALAAKGAALFADNSCAACHGEDAKTPALPAYPKLAGQNADYLYKQLEDFKSGARSNDADDIMKDAITDIDDQDLRAISYWLSTGAK
ncbi:Cytochrome c4 [hydrothermal vent metagenome]|uniref:Cytochrome c4 n=1 Tax=hydrothermal vent metagenome TaxID=652676 RepID=A0A3B0UL30_9ZZZZ